MKMIAWIVMALWLVFSVTTSAANFPAPAGKLVSDFAQVLTPEQVQKLDGTLREFERTTTHEIAVVTVPTLQGMSVEEYATRLFEQWGIGKKAQDNGVLLLLGMQEHKIRIEVGYGLEGAITDGTAGTIIREMGPKMRANDAYGALTGATNALMSASLKEPATIATEQLLAKTKADNDATLFWFFMIVGTVVTIVLIGVIWISVEERRRQKQLEAERLAAERYVEAQRRMKLERDQSDDYLRLMDMRNRQDAELASRTPRVTKASKRRASSSRVSEAASVASVSSWTPSPSYDSGSSYSPSDSGSSSFDFGGGSSGGGGASGSW